MSEESESSLDDGSDESSFLYFRRFLFLSRFFFFGDDSDNDGSGSGSSGTCPFTFCSVNYVVHVSGGGYGIFVPTIIESIGEMVKCYFPFCDGEMVKYSFPFCDGEMLFKVGRVIEIFFCSIF